jgi:hypothetical protein
MSQGNTNVEVEHLDCGDVHVLGVLEKLKNE